jgi:Ca2+-binding EF-hand superfamily protein
MRTLHLLLAAVCGLAGTTLATAQQDKPRRSDAAELLKRLDKNQDGFLQPAELPAPVQNRFEKLDRNQDGKLSEAELQRVAPRLAQLVGPPPAAPPPDVLFRLLDANNDGKLSRDELENAAKVLEKLDRNKDGMIERAELATPPRGARGGRPGKVITPAARGERRKDR